MFKYTKHTLKKMEELFSALEYTIRYERGNFQSGYCMVENRKIAVINKFFDVEARINCLLEILTTIQVNPESLEDKMQDFYQKLVREIEENSSAEEEEVVIESTSVQS